MCTSLLGRTIDGRGLRSVRRCIPLCVRSTSSICRLSRTGHVMRIRTGCSRRVLVGGGGVDQLLLCYFVLYLLLLTVSLTCIFRMCGHCGEAGRHRLVARETRLSRKGRIVGRVGSRVRQVHGRTSAVGRSCGGDLVSLASRGGDVRRRFTLVGRETSSIDRAGGGVRRSLLILRRRLQGISSTHSRLLTRLSICHCFSTRKIVSRSYCGTIIAVCGFCGTPLITFLHSPRLGLAPCRSLLYMLSCRRLSARRVRRGLKGDGGALGGTVFQVERGLSTGVSLGGGVGSLKSFLQAGF